LLRGELFGRLSAKWSWLKPWACRRSADAIPALP
jgi:hypothetical protein